MCFETPYKKLLNLIQRDFPLKKQPFKIIGERLGLTEREVLDFLISLKEKGILRHLGGVPNSSKLKRYTLLCATTLSSEQLSIGYEIANLPQVTHAYIRKHILNFWFTLVTKNREEAENLIFYLERVYDLKIKKFPLIKNFKLEAIFRL